MKKALTVLALLATTVPCYAQTAPAFAPNRANLKFLPPLEYSHAYSGRLHVIRAGQGLLEHFCPPSPKEKRVGCAIRVDFGAECLVTISDDSVLKSLGVYDYRIVLEHEIGHCNGWGSDHRGARPMAEYLTHKPL